MWGMIKHLTGRTSKQAGALRRAYRLMRAHFGHQGWWPGETPFEVCVGAILTQNTSWSNVERAIANLKAARLLDARKLYALKESELAGLLRPAGYFNVKARRLRCFLRVLVEEHDGDLGRLFAGETATVRERLLAINGVGPETADSMLLYAGGHHSFVIDAYTKRIFQRHNWCGADAGYKDLQRLCESALDQKPRGERLDYWQDYHAQLVIVGKEYCRTRQPRCEECPLKSLLPRKA
jgi:endonuclease III related protein